jgi:hypothetical protein
LEKVKIDTEKFVSRDNVAKDLKDLRSGKDFPEGKIKLR